MEKLTIANKFDEVVKILSGEASVFSAEDAIKFLNDRKAKATRKNGSRKETARQKENGVLKEVILKVLADAESGMTVTQILATEPVKNFDSDVALSNQRVTAVLQQMIRIDGTVHKEKDGKSMMYFAN
jgi:hypothetical protein